MVELTDILNQLTGKFIMTHHQAYWEDEAEELDIYQIKGMSCAYKDFRCMFPDATDDQIEEAKTFLKPEKDADCGSCGDCSGDCASGCGGCGETEEFKLYRPKPQGYIGIVEDDELHCYNMLFIDVWNDERTGANLMKIKDITEALEIAVLYKQQMDAAAQGGCDSCPNSGGCDH